MDSLLGSPEVQGSIDLFSFSLKNQNNRADLLIIQGTFGQNEDDASSNALNFGDLSKGLSISAQKILEKINALLKNDLPDGVQSLKPEDVTPEATADRIVQGATAFYDLYAKQHPELEGEELLTSFMETIRGGINEGYNDAFNILEGLGAFEFDSVKSGVERTKELIEGKLVQYENYMREKLGLDSEEDLEIAPAVRNEVLTQAGVRTLSVIA